MTTSRFDFSFSQLPGVAVIQRKRLEDHRGTFGRVYCSEEFREVGLLKPIAQINHSFTRVKGTVRGMHFQYPPHSETKIVSCLKGEIFDVALDIRRDASTFLQWHAEILSAANQRSLLISEGFAHGFQTLTDECELIYLHTATYAPHAEGGLNVRDPRFGIPWPVEITELSNRDQSYGYVGDAFDGLRI